MKYIEGNNFVDDRGMLTFFNSFSFDKVKRVYLVRNHSKNYIRAWHGHLKEEKYVQVVQGAALVGAVPLDDMKLESCYKKILSEHTPGILHIPNGYANGFKTLTENTILQFFSTSTLDESKGDDIRFDFDEVNIWEEDYR